LLSILNCILLNRLLFVDSVSIRKLYIFSTEWVSIVVAESPLLAVVSGGIFDVPSEVFAPVMVSVGPLVSEVRQGALVFKGDGLPESLADDALDLAMVCFISNGIGVANVGSRSSKSTSVNDLCLSPPNPRVFEHADVGSKTIIEVASGLGSTSEATLLLEIVQV
jgi:hypothetical protein